MVTWLPWLIAGVSTAGCLFLWFRDVRRIMQERKTIVESAASQLRACCKRCVQSANDPAAVAIWERSEDIYR